jgi:hypothetical protein
VKEVPCSMDIYSFKDAAILCILYTILDKINVPHIYTILDYYQNLVAFDVSLSDI